MVGEQKTGVGEQDLKDFGKQAEKLDRALVTGLMLEVILETSSLPVDPQTLRYLVKTRLKDSLAVNLAGRVTLDRFRHLLSQVDIWFPLYYPLTTAGASKATAATPVQAIPAPAAAAPSRRGLRVDRLRAWLQEEGQGAAAAPAAPEGQPGPAVGVSGPHPGRLVPASGLHPALRGGSQNRLGIFTEVAPRRTAAP